MYGKYRISTAPTTPATPVSHGFGSPSTYFPSPFNLTTPTSTRPSAKRKHVDLDEDKENALPTLGPSAKKPYTPRRDPRQKLEIVF
jgi:hypothetical protein